MARSISGFGLAFLLLATLAGRAELRADTVIASEPGRAETPVLLYHRFHPTEADALTVRTSTFAEHLAWLARQRYRVIRLRDIVTRLQTKAQLEPQTVALTVDDGDPSLYSQLFPLVRRHRVPVTLFINPVLISRSPGSLTWQQLAEMVQSGLVEVQAHSYDHPNLVAERNRRSPEDYQKFLVHQLDDAKTVLAQRLGVTVDLLAWPFGAYDLALKRRAAQSGYIAAFGVEPRPAQAGDDLFGIPRIPVVDGPLTLYPPAVAK